MSNHGKTEDSAVPATAEEPDSAASSARHDWRRSVATRWLEFATTLIELAGLGVASAGFWLIRPWAWLIVLGAGFMVLGVALSPRFARRWPLR